MFFNKMLYIITCYLLMNFGVLENLQKIEKKREQGIHYLVDTFFLGMIYYFKYYLFVIM